MHASNNNVTESNNIDKKDLSIREELIRREDKMWARKKLREKLEIKSLPKFLQLIEEKDCLPFSKVDLSYEKIDNETMAKIIDLLPQCPEGVTLNLFIFNNDSFSFKGILDILNFLKSGKCPKFTL